MLSFFILDHHEGIEWTLYKCYHADVKNYCWGWGDAQLAKCLVDIHENLSSLPHYLHQSQVCWVEGTQAGSPEVHGQIF